MSTGYDTVLGLKMREAGVRPSRVEARKILAKAVEQCRQAGASHSDIVQELSLICERMRNLADEMPGEGQLYGASNGQMHSADPRQPQGDGAGQERHADKASECLPVPSPTQRDGGDHSWSADEAKPFVPSTVSPQSRDVGQSVSADKASAVAPRPVPAPPSAVAIRALADTNCSAAKIVLDLATWRVDGRLVAKMTIDEAYERGKAMAADGILLMLPKRHYANVNGNALVGDILNNRTLNDLVSKAKERANAAA